MTPHGGNRHLLVIYSHMLNRWWHATLTIGIMLVFLAGALGGLPVLFPQAGFVWLEDWRLWLLGGAGGVTLVFSLFLITVRRKAYVQAFPDHLRIVTPFLRLNIAYRRIQRSYSAQMQKLFPPGAGTKWQRELLRPLADRTAVVIEMAGLPVSRRSLRFFLSPFFFPDATARLSLLVPDWMAFSTELDSLRSEWQNARRQTPSHPNSALGRDFQYKK